MVLFKWFLTLNQKKIMLTVGFDYNRSMASTPSSIITDALFQKGATLLKIEKADNGSPIIYLQWKGQFVKIDESVEDGLILNLSESSEYFHDDLKWRSIYSLTVPGFDSFSEDQKIEWVVSIPKSEADYLAFLIQQLYKFDNFIKVPRI